MHTWTSCPCINAPRYANALAPNGPVCTNALAPADLLAQMCSTCAHERAHSNESARTNTFVPMELHSRISSIYMHERTRSNGFAIKISGFFLQKWQVNRVVYCSSRTTSQWTEMTCHQASNNGNNHKEKESFISAFSQWVQPIYTQLDLLAKNASKNRKFWNRSYYLDIRATFFG